MCPSCRHINQGSHSLVSFLCLSICARCYKGIVNVCNVEDKGGQWCCYAIQRNSDTITWEGQNPIREVLARSCWKVDPSQEASGGCKVRSSTKARAFYTLRRSSADAMGAGDNDCAWPPMSFAERECWCLDAPAGFHARRLRAALHKWYCTGPLGSVCMQVTTLVHEQRRQRIDAVARAACASVYPRGRMSTCTKMYMRRRCCLPLPTTRLVCGREHSRTGENVGTRATMSMRKDKHAQKLLPATSYGNVCMRARMSALARTCTSRHCCPPPLW